MKEIGEDKFSQTGERDFIDKKLSGEDSLHCIANAILYETLNSRFDLSRIYPQDATLFYVAAAVVGIYDFTRKENEKESSYENPELNYNVTEVSYRGRPVKIGDTQMHKGDKFLFLQLPHISVDPFAPKYDPNGSIRLINEMVKQVVNSASSEFADNTGSKLVVISASQPKGESGLKIASERKLESHLMSGIVELFPGAERINYRELMDGRILTANEARLGLMVIPREVFDKLPSTPYEIFLRACIKSGDMKIINDYLPAMKAVSSKEEKEKAMTEFRKYITQKFSSGLDDKFGGTEIGNIGGVRLYGNDRQRLTKSVILNSSSKASFTYQITSAPDSVIDVDLKSTDALLGVANQNFEGILDNFPTNINIRYVLYEMFRKYSYDELFLENKVSADRFLSELKDSGLILKSPFNAYQTIVNSFRTTAKRSRYPLTYVSPLLRTIALFAVLQTGVNLWANSNIDLGFDSGNSNFNDPGEPFAAKFGSGEGGSQIIWKVSSTGLDTSGYYTTSTSDLMVGGEWVETHDGHDVEYSSDIEGDVDDPGQEILLERILHLNSGDTGIKIPIKDGTQLGAVRVTNRDGEVVKSVTFLEDDGSVLLIIPKTKGNIARVTVVLDEADDAQVHAHSSLRAVNFFELDELANKTFSASFGNIDTSNIDEKTADRIEDNIAENVSSSHMYSVDPKYNKYLDNLNTPEEVLNAIADLGVCDCDVCNTEVVLLSSMVPETKVSMATGFLLNSDNVASGKGEYLTSLALHGYGIDEKGRILDGTPSDILLDKATKKYFSQLNGGGLYDDQWDDSEQDLHEISISERINNYTEGFINLLEEYQLAIGLISLSTAGVILAKPSYKAYKRLEDKKIAYRIIEKAVVRSMTIQELRYMHSFFINISYNTYADTTKGSELERLYEEKDGIQYDKKSLFNLLRTDTNKSRLSEYLLEPNKYEVNLRITSVQKAKMRIMAKMLVNPRYWS